MPAKGTVGIQLSREQAETASRWLTKEYQPSAPPDLPIDWESRQKMLAYQLGETLAKAARRRRPSAILNLRIPLGLAQWFATFMRPDGWWDFDGVCFPGQLAPEPIRGIALVFLKAASLRRGRPRLTIRGTEEQLARGEAAETDARVLRRLRAEKRGLEWEKNEIDEAGPEPES